MLVSIVIPTFNREHVLQFALNSISQQSYKNWEVIISDDGSTDKTADIVAEFAKQVEQSVTFIKSIKNQGVGCARNVGIKQAKGDFIAFIDSDDRWLAHHLQKSIDILNNNLVKMKSSLDDLYAVSTANKFNNDLKELDLDWLSNRFNNWMLHHMRLRLHLNSTIIKTC